MFSNNDDFDMPLNNWNTAQATQMDFMFYGADG